MRLIYLVIICLAIPNFAFAGDSYLLCDQQDEEIESNLLVNGKSGVTFEKKIGHETFQIVVLVTENQDLYNYEILTINESNGGFSRRVFATGNRLEQIQVVDDIYCKIVD